MILMASARQGDFLRLWWDVSEASLNASLNAPAVLPRSLGEVVL